MLYSSGELYLPVLLFLGLRSRAIMPMLEAVAQAHNITDNGNYG